MDWKMLAHIFVPILLAIALNTFIYIKRWNVAGNDAQEKGTLPLPPGYVIAIIWTVLLGLLGYVHYLLFPSPAHWLVVATIFYCLAYPVLTRIVKAGLLNTGALIAAAVVTGATAYTKKEATVYTLPLLVWVSYVNLATA